MPDCEGVPWGLVRIRGALRMKCANCGRDNPSGARYCVHCGAEQSLPTPIAAVAAAAIAARTRPQLHAANAAQAEPAPDPAYHASVGSEPRTDLGAGERAPVTAGNDATAHPPAYAAGPRHLGLAMLTLALCIALAIVAFAVWMFSGDGASHEASTKTDSDASVMSAFPPEATPANPRRPAADRQASGSESQAAQSPSTGTVAASSAAKAEAAPAKTEAATAPPSDASAAAETAKPVEIKPLPPRHAAAKATRRAPAEKTPPAVVAEPATPPARAPAVAAAPVTVTPVVDRWTRMSDELSRCTREDFIARVICDQRVRLRYCDGYWGKAQQCPVNTNPDRGQ